MEFLRLYFEFIEEPAGDCVTGSLAGVGLPTSDDRVDVGRIKLQSVAAATRAIGGDHRRSASEKGIQDDFASCGSVHDGVSHEGHDLNGRMACEKISLLSGFAEGRDAGIFPNVRSVSAELSQLDVVPMGGIAMFEDEYEFMPAPIE